MLTISQEDRHYVANRAQNGPLGQLDPAAPLLMLQGYCPQCGGEATEVRDDLSLREFRISGLCQSCQDLIFGSEDGEAVEVSTDPAEFLDVPQV